MLFRDGTIQTADGLLVIPEFGGAEFEGVTGIDFWEGFNDSRNVTGFIETTRFWGDGRAIAFFNGWLVNAHTPSI